MKTLASNSAINTKSFYIDIRFHQDLLNLLKYYPRCNPCNPCIVAISVRIFFRKYMHESTSVCIVIKQHIRMSR